MCTLRRVFSCWTVFLVYNGKECMFLSAWKEVLVDEVILLYTARCVKRKKKKSRLWAMFDEFSFVA